MPPAWYSANRFRSLGWIAYPVGTEIHFLFSMAWGVLFARFWPYFRERGYEATFLALIYAVLAWIAMYAAIMMASDNHPDCFDPGGGHRRLHVPLGVRRR